ncbi:hypothetical protein [Streptomyces sp. NPDC058739]|uniref:hypothetical protein n=1 Tax=Streptomyces sp. NPDC058739 TaxID=3346618 RepID=UPI0036C9BF4A
MNTEEDEAGLFEAVRHGDIDQLRDLLARLRAPLPAGLLDHARACVRTGAEAELERLTGLAGPAVRTRLWEETGCWYEELELGGRTLRDGHSAILTELERRARLRVPFGDLLDRALAHPDRDHAAWAQAVSELGDRQDDETWAAAETLSEDPDPLHRLFAADVLLCLVVADLANEDGPFLRRAAELVPWALREPDPAVLDVLLNTLTWTDSQKVKGVGIAYAAHPDPAVRGWVPQLLDHEEHEEHEEPAGDGAAEPGALTPPSLTPPSLAALLALARDPDAGVRARACSWMLHQPVRAPEIADALYELTRDERRRTRIDAVAALAHRDDPRCVAAEARIGPLEDGLDPDGLPLLAVWYHQRRMEERAGDA